MKSQKLYGHRRRLRTAVAAPLLSYYEALKKHPFGSNGLPRILNGSVRAPSFD